MRENHQSNQDQLCPKFETCQIPAIIKIIKMVIEQPDAVAVFLDHLKIADEKTGCAGDCPECEGK